jgi:hypothetical protein
VDSAGRARKLARRGGRSSPSAAASISRLRARQRFHNIVRLAVAALALVAWVLGVRYIGVVVSSLTVFTFLWWYMSRRWPAPIRGMRSSSSVLDYARALAIILIIIGASYPVCTRYLYVPLPRGLLI